MSKPWVATYRSQNAPKSQEWMAFLYLPQIAKDGTAYQARLPVFFRGQSEIEVTDAANAFWDAEVKKQFESAEKREVALEARRAAAADRKAKKIMQPEQVA